MLHTSSDLRRFIIKQWKSDMEAKSKLSKGCVYWEATSARLRLLDLPNVLLYEILMRSFQLDYPIEPNFWKILNSLAVGNIAHCILHFNQNLNKERWTVYIAALHSWY